MEETHHCLHVLRMKRGEEAMIVDGMGNQFHGELISESSKGCVFKILHSTIQKPLSYKLHLVFALLKNQERIEWLVEKATEIGIHEITPIVSQYTERNKVNVDRLRKISISAMKQSQKAYLPKINDVTTFKNFILHNSFTHRYIAHCCSLYERIHINAINLKEEMIFLIGPEGDFSEEEVKLANDNGFVSVSLGNTRLRTETAALMVCATFALKSSN